jgi:hypothetical protein
MFQLYFLDLYYDLSSPMTRHSSSSQERYYEDYVPVTSTIPLYLVVSNTPTTWWGPVRKYIKNSRIQEDIGIGLSARITLSLAPRGPYKESSSGVPIQTSNPYAPPISWIDLSAGLIALCSLEVSWKLEEKQK